jgi:hypothetical protein
MRSPAYGPIAKEKPDALCGQPTSALQLPWMALIIPGAQRSRAAPADD